MSDEITHDSWAIGWKKYDEEHYRQIVLIQNGKVLAHDIRTDSFLKGHYASGPVVTQKHIDEWADDVMKSLVVAPS